MDEKQLRRLIGRVKDGKLSRRAFVGRMLALGITAPLASEMLAFCGAARARAFSRPRLWHRSCSSMPGSPGGPE